MEAAIWGFVGTLIGAMVSLGTTYFNNQHTARLQAAKVKAESDERRLAFQRETLLQLQDELMRYLRFTWLTYLADREASHGTGGWRNTALPPEVNTGAMESARDLGKLIERVADDSLRNQLKALASTTSSFMFDKLTPQEAERLHNKITVEGGVCAGRVGEVLRSLL